jgi:ribonuclease HI
MIEIYTDGACLKNPGGPGGWAYVMLKDGMVYENGGYTEVTTNNKMELTAAIEALKAVNQYNQKAAVHTDSQYVKNGITTWIKSWKSRGWERKGDRGGKEVKNLELWQELDELNSNLIEWHWVRGHAGNVHNNRADEIASGFARRKKVDLANGAPSGYISESFNIEPDKTEAKPKAALETKTDIKLLFSLPFAGLLSDLLIRVYGFSKNAGASSGSYSLRNPYTEISWDDTGLASIKPIITSKTVEIIENLKKEEEHHIDECLKRKPLEFPADFALWKNIHFQQFLRPIIKGMSNKWKIEKEGNRLSICLLENPAESGEIECKKEYCWVKLPGEKHRAQIISAAENAIIFPDRVVAAVRTEKNMVDMVSFYLCGNSQNIINCYNPEILAQQWKEIEQDEKQRILSLIWKRLDRSSRLQLRVPEPVASIDSSQSARLVFQSLFLLHSDAGEIIKSRKKGDTKFKLDVIMEEPDDQEWGSDSLVANFPEWQLFKKPSNAIEKRAVEMAKFLM